jgi:hypothetical protein
MDRRTDMNKLIVAFAILRTHLKTATRNPGRTFEHNIVAHPEIMIQIIQVYKPIILLFGRPKYFG